MDALKESFRHSARTYNMQANDCFRRRHFDEAISLYSKAIDYHPNNPAYYCNRAEAYNNTCFMINAMEDCRRALALCPRYSRAYNRMALMNISCHNWIQAIRCSQTSLKCEPTNDVYRTNLALGERGYSTQDSLLQFIPPYLFEYLIPLPNLPTTLLSIMTDVTFDYIDINGPILTEMTGADDDWDINPYGPFFLKSS